MISSILAAGFVARCTTQLVACPVSVADESDDVSVMLAVRSFTRVASSREVQHKAGDMVEDTSLIQASWFRQPVVQHHEVKTEVLSTHADIRHLGNFSGAAFKLSTHADIRHLGDFSGAAFKRLHLLTIQSMLHAEMLPFYGVFASVLLVVLAASCACFCRFGLMHKDQRGSNLALVPWDDEDKDSTEVWQKVRTCHGDESLTDLLKKINLITPGYITAAEVQRSIKDKQVKKKLVELGIPKADFLSVFRLLESSSDTRNGSVKIEEFIKANESHEGHLMKLSSMLDEGRGASPPGFITSDDLRFMMQNREVAKQFLLLGISSSDAFGVFSVLLSSASLWESKGLVNLKDFIEGCKTLSDAPRRQVSWVDQ